MQTDEAPLTLTVPEAGRLLGLKPRASYLAAQRGDLSIVRFGRLVRVPRQALMQILANASQTSAA